MEFNRIMRIGMYRNSCILMSWSVVGRGPDFWQCGLFRILMVCGLTGGDTP